MQRALRKYILPITAVLFLYMAVDIYML